MSIKIEDIKPNLLKKISEIAKDKNITEEEAINEILEKGIEIKSKNKKYQLKNRQTQKKYKNNNEVINGYNYHLTSFLFVFIVYCS